MACSLRVAVKGVETDAVALRETNGDEEPDRLESERDAEAEAVLAEEAVDRAMRGEAARRAGREWAKDRRAAMMVKVRIRESI